jgi:hypothetical protein
VNAGPAREPFCCDASNQKRLAAARASDCSRGPDLENFAEPNDGNPPRPKPEEKERKVIIVTGAEGLKKWAA